MASTSPRMFSNVAEIENMMIALGLEGVKGKIGRQSNFTVDAHVREAVFNPQVRAVVGVIRQFSTPDLKNNITASTVVVRPRTTIFYYQDASNGNVYLLETIKGGGPKRTVKYNVLVNDGTFSKTPWIFGLQVPSGTYVDAGHQLMATWTHPVVSRPPLSPSSSSSSAPGASDPISSLPGLSLPLAGLPSGPVTTSRPVQDLAGENEDGGAGSTNTQAVRKTATRKTSAKTSSGAALAPIPKSSAGIKKTKSRAKTPPPAAAIKTGTRRTRGDQAEKKRPGETDETFYGRVIDIAEQVALVENGSIQFIRFDPSQMALSLPSLGLKPATSNNPLPSNIKKRKRSAEDGDNVAHFAKKAKTILRGWNASPSVSDSDLEAPEAKALVSVRVVERVPVKNLKRGRIQGFCLDNKRMTLDYSIDPREVYGKEYPRNLVAQIEMPYTVVGKNKILPENSPYVVKWPERKAEKEEAEAKKAAEAAAENGTTEEVEETAEEDVVVEAGLVETESEAGDGTGDGPGDDSGVEAGDDSGDGSGDDSVDDSGLGSGVDSGDEKSGDEEDVVE